MNLYERIKNKEESISLVGLGYVGMPIAVAFAKKVFSVEEFLSSPEMRTYRSSLTGPVARAFKKDSGCPKEL